MTTTQLSEHVSIGGLRIVKSIHMVKRGQLRFPNSKRRRIQAKWAKRESNYGYIPDPKIYIMADQGCVIMHPATWKRIEREMNALARLANKLQQPRLL